MRVKLKATHQVIDIYPVAVFGVWMYQDCVSDKQYAWHEFDPIPDASIAQPASDSLAVQAISVPIDIKVSGTMISRPVTRPVEPSELDT